MPNWKKIVAAGSNASLNTLTLTGTSAQGSESTTLMINGSGVIGTRELGSNAFTSTTIPTNNNQLTNGAGYITDGNTNWNNSYGFITGLDWTELGGAQEEINISGFNNDAGYITSYVNTTYTAGTGLKLVGTQFRNTAPDQTVTLTGAGATTISGTYPNFTITSTDTNTNTNTVTSIRRDNTGTYRTGNINLVGGSNVTITETSAGVFSFSSTDTNTNTTYSAGTGLTLTGTTFSLTTPITNNNQLTNGAGYITSYVNTQRSDEEIRDVAAAQWINGTNTTVVKNDAGNTIKINSVNTNTQRSDDEIRNVTIDQLVAGSNVTLSAEGETIVISSTDTNTNTQLSTAQVRSKFSGTGINTTTGVITNTTYSVGDGGLTQKNFTTTLKTKLDGIAAGATNVTNNNQLTNGAGYQTATQVSTAISSLVDSAPATLNTLNELAAALGDDPNFSTTITNNIAKKLPLTGGVMSGKIYFNTSNVNNGFEWNVNSDSAGITFKNTGDGDNNSYFNFFTKDNGNEYFKFSHTHYQKGATDFVDIKDGVVRLNGNLYVNASQSGNADAGTNALTGGNLVWHNGNFSSTNISNWNTAYGWGNHVGLYDAAGSAAAVNQKIDEEVLPAIPTNNNQLTNGAGYIKSYVNTQRSDEEIRDVASAQWINGTNTTVVKDDAGNTIKINSVNTNTQLSTAQVRSKFSGTGINTTTGVITNTTYSVGDGGLTQKNFTTTLKSKLDGIAAGATNVTNNDQLTNGAGYITSYVNTQRSDEEIRDVASAQWINGTNTTVVKNDAGNTIKINAVNTNTQRSDEEIRNVTIDQLQAGSNVTLSAEGETILISSTDTNTNTQLSTAQVRSKFSGTGINTTTGVITNTTYSVGDGGLTQKNFTTTLKSKLDGIAAGANNYSHPTYNGDDFSVDTGALTGATVVSDIDINVTTDGQGHVTDANGVVATRTLTLANLGYTGATNANYITNNNQLSNGAGYLTSANDRVYITDSRGGYRLPSYYNDRYAQWDFQSEADTKAGGDGWHAIQTISKWSSFNSSHRQEQLIFTGDNLKRRTANSDTEWGELKTMWDSGNLDAFVGASVSNDTITFTKANGGTVAVSTSDANTNYYLNGISKSGNTLTFSVNGTTNRSYTFGSNAFTSYSNHVGLYDGVGSADAVNQRIDNEVLPLIQIPAITSNGSTPSLNSGISGAEVRSLIGAQAAGTYNTIIGTDSDINTSGATIIDNIFVTDGVITSMGTRALTLANLGFTGATNANYITNNNQLTNGAGYQTSAQVNTAIQTVVDSAPAALNTLNELAAALGDDANFAGTMTTALAGKLSTTGKAADSNLLDGLDLSTGRNNVANKVVRTNSSGYAEFGWINTTSGNTTGTITDFYVNTNDGYIRKATKAHVKSQLGLGSAAYVNTSAFDAAGSADAVNQRIDTEVLPIIPTNNNQLPNGAGYITSYVNTQRSDEEIRDVAAAQWVNGTNTTVVKNDAGNTIKINAVNTNTTYSAGSGLTLSGTTFSLANTYDNYVKWQVSDGNTSDNIESGDKLTFVGKGSTVVSYDPAGKTMVIDSTDTNTNTTYSADGNYGMTLSGTTFRLENDRRRNSSTTDIYTGNTHDFTWYDASVGIRWYTAGSEDMRLQDNGTLHVDGDIIAYSSTISDERLKDNVSTIENPLDKIKALRGVEYDWNSGSRKGKRDLGLIAQEVEEVLPHIVHEHEMPLLDDSDTLYKTVDYEKMVAVLIEGMKEQQTQIESLKSEIETIKGKL